VFDIEEKAAREGKWNFSTGKAGEADSHLHIVNGGGHIP